MAAAKYNMIKEIQNECEISGVNSPLLARIFIAFKYKSGSDNAWLQLNEKGSMTALLSSVENNFTIALTQEADLEEIKEFLRFVGCRSIVSNIPLNEAPKEHSLFEFKEAKVPSSTADFLVLNNEASTNDYKEIYSLLYSDAAVNFENWYYGFSKRIAKNDAKAVALRQNGEALAMALAPMIFNSSAIISGVFTLTEHRNKGYSRTVIYKLIEELEKVGVSQCFLWCEKSLESFYEKIGFEKIGCIYQETEL